MGKGQGQGSIGPTSLFNGKKFQCDKKCFVWGWVYAWCFVFKLIAVGPFLIHSFINSADFS
jgi:hypothetical protein